MMGLKITLPPNVKPSIRLSAAVRRIEDIANGCDSVKIENEVIEFLRQSLRDRLEKLTKAQQHMFWTIHMGEPYKAKTVEQIPEKYLVPSINVCDRTINS